MLNLSLDTQGNAYSVRRDGTRPERLPGWALPTRVRAALGPVVMVHGFLFDPWAGKESPHRTDFKRWRTLFAGTRASGLAWPSAPSVYESWAGGHLHPYHCAWARAHAAARTLRACLRALEDQPVDLVAHSLGTKVVLDALNTFEKLPVRRVLLFNAAADCETADISAFLQPHTQFFNVGCTSDAVLRYLGALFSPGALYEPVVGLHGLTDKRIDLPNWTDLPLDDPDVKAWALRRGYGYLHGDNPNGILDHWHTWTDDRNSELYRGILSGR